MPSFCSPDWILSALQPLSVHHLKSITMQRSEYFEKVPVHFDDLSINEPEKVIIIVEDSLNFSELLGTSNTSRNLVCTFVVESLRKWICLFFSMTTSRSCS